MRVPIPMLILLRTNAVAGGRCWLVRPSWRQPPCDGRQLLCSRLGFSWLTSRSGAPLAHGTDLARNYGSDPGRTAPARQTGEKRLLCALCLAGLLSYWAQGAPRAQLVRKWREEGAGTWGALSSACLDNKSELHRQSPPPLPPPD